MQQLKSPSKAVCLCLSLHQAVPPLSPSIIFSTVIALIEVYLFAFIGNLVDLLSTADRATFWEVNSTKLILMGALVLLVLPILNFISEAISHQGLRGAFAMRIRWLAHRYVLRQSMDFFHNDYAGRVATKVMQAALGVRDAVMKITEVVVYVTVYFVGALVLVATSDYWLMLPLLVWLSGYALACWYFVPRLGKLSEAQAELRSLVVGRVVDSYTNISTVKLFAHAEREDSYAREGMGWMWKASIGHAHVHLHDIDARLLSGILIFMMSASPSGSGTRRHHHGPSPSIGLTCGSRPCRMDHLEVAGLLKISASSRQIETVARDRS